MPEARAGARGRLREPPQGPGGETNKGVTRRVYDDYRRKAGKHVQSVRYITDAEVADIYRTGYWNACAAPKLPRGVDYATFDGSVNSGVSRGVRWLQPALGIKADGKAGPQTVANAKAADAVATVKAMCAKRMGFLRGLSTFTTFGKGWTRRVAGVEAKGVAMASANPKATAAAESKAAANTAAAQKAGATGAGAGAGGTATQVDPSAFDALSSVALIGVTAALVILVVVLIARSRVKKARADAHAAVAEEVLS